ncbi:c-type cytochrome biogenesis protein CcmI [Roseovarius sp. A46]|uniref:c-type cytochrome biogenesis protein CcmI n=1 Tax=Roseovarius sp. A46 TaxID=2109331 RepID=UPI001010695E|nr:c-type cytochrome biogenesis protein CcmI [Roseovarius sp. A46]RXV62216.1 c-type cytochrome biogenesis protein CcmI [Roseovarius sp. A46]
MSFWIIAAALAIGTGLLLALAALRGRAGAEPPVSYDLRVYRDQLREIERDAGRGVIADGDAERLRAEVSRRILAADAQLRAGGATAGQPRIAGRAGALVAMVLVACGGLALYAALGAPGYGDMPLAARIAASETARAERLGQEAAEARFGPGEMAPPEGTSQEHLELVEQLRKVVAARPEDQQGLRFLVRSEAALGRMVAARKAQEKLVALRGDAASATDHATLAELMIEAAGGYISTDAAAALRAALERNPRAPTARFYLGLWHLQLDRPDLAFPVWRDLLEDSTPDAPWVPTIRAEIGEIAQRAGVRYTPPEESEGRGPSAADMEAAGDMDPEARAAMIRGMVSRLSERLATEGGPPEDWARLINAYGVMGETAQARRIWTEARETFGGDARALGILRTAAEAAGVTE